MIETEMALPAVEEELAALLQKLLQLGAPPGTPPHPPLADTRTQAL